MQIVHQTPSIDVTTSSLRDIAADLLIIPIFDSDALTGEPDLHKAVDGEIDAARGRGEFKSKPYELFVTTLRGWKTGRVALIGLGPKKEFAPDRLRRVAITGALAARSRGLTRIAIVHRPDTGVGTELVTQLFVEGAIIGNYDGASYRTTDPPRVWLASVTIAVADKAGADRGLE